MKQIKKKKHVSQRIDPMNDSKRQQRLEQEAWDYAYTKAGQLSRILVPHKYANDNDIFGTNSIGKLWMDPGYDTGLWPEPVLPKLSVSVAEPDIFHDFYMPLLATMMDKYFTHVFEKYGFKDYDELGELPQFDISRQCQDGTALYYATYPFQDDDRSCAQTYGLSIFTPCVSEFVIKMHKQHMIYCHLLDKAETGCRFRTEDYLLSGHNICCTGYNVLQLEYDDATADVHWSCLEYVTYEELLYGSVKDMHWSVREEQFWQDVFGVIPVENPVVLWLPTGVSDDFADGAFDEDGDFREYIIPQRRYAERIAKDLRKVADITVKIDDDGEKAMMRAYLDRLTGEIPKLLQAIAYINVQLIKSGTSVLSPENRSSGVHVGEMLVRPRRTLEIKL
jgi:hypothetical protein